MAQKQHHQNIKKSKNNLNWIIVKTQTCVIIVNQFYLLPTEIISFVHLHVRLRAEIKQELRMAMIIANVQRKYQKH